MPDHPETAGELVRAARDGSKEAWTALVDRFAPMILAVARSHRLGPADVDDVYQVVWLRLAEHLDRIREPERVAGWLATTARNESLRVVRRHPLDSSDIDLDALASDEKPVDDLLASDELRVVVAAGFAALSDRCRRLLTYLLVKELDYEEVSGILDMPIGSIGPTRQRCLQKLRGNLGAEAALI